VSYTGLLSYYSSPVTALTIYNRGESGVGKWTIVVKDTQVNEHSGTFIDWHLKLWGEAVNPKLATLIPMPEDTDDDDHDVIATTTAAATTTLVAVPTGTSPAENPTDHPDRPVNSKPTGTSAGDASPTSSSPAESSTGEKSSWLPGFLPTFGVSAKTQVWIYGAIALIVIFCCGLGVYFYLARRKRLRNNPRDNYEFDIITDEEAQGLTQSAAGGRRQKGKRRAGELYDAFAAGSEDEDFSDFEAGDDSGYTDKMEGADADEDADGKHVIGDDDDEEDGDRGDEKTKDRL
jgi:kexin